MYRCLLLMLAMWSLDGFAALEFHTVNSGGKSVLYVKDGEDGIEKGDSQKLSQVMSRRRYAEVWLHSGGGNLYEGVLIGLVLRRHGAFVRVRSGDQCVSACTVAFLGGLLRTVDKGGSYEVHAYSGVRNGLRTKQQEKAVVADPDAFLNQFAREQFSSDAPFWSAGLFEYFRLMIQPVPTKERLQIFDTYRHNNLRQKLQTSAQIALNQYLLEQLSQDAQRVKTEGLPAGHDIAMRLERDAMQASISQLKTLAAQQQLGHRATAAIRILQTMFESSILSTSALNQSTLREYGYTNVVLP